MRKRIFRTIAISRSATKDQLIAASLRAFHIHDDPRYYILTDVYGKYMTGRGGRERDRRETGSRMLQPLTLSPFPLLRSSLFHGQKETRAMIVSLFCPFYHCGSRFVCYSIKRAAIFGHVCLMKNNMTFVLPPPPPCLPQQIPTTENWVTSCQYPV